MILIAASGARQATKDAADFVCVGSDDQEQIEAAINSMSATGGIIHLSEGTFNLSGPLVLDSVPVQLQGEGRSATVLSCDYAETGNGIELASNYHSLRDFSLVNGDNLNRAIVLRSAHNHLMRLWVEGASTGIRGETGTNSNVLEQVYARDCTEYGFILYGIANRLLSCSASRSSLGGVAGFRFQESGSLYQGCIAERFPVGLDVRDWSVGISINAHVEYCAQALRVLGSEGTEPKGITVNIFAHGCTSPALPALQIRRSVGVSVRATLSGVASGKAVEITDDAHNAQVDYTLAE